MRGKTTTAALRKITDIKWKGNWRMSRRRRKRRKQRRKTTSSAPAADSVIKRMQNLSQSMIFLRLSSGGGGGGGGGQLIRGRQTPVSVFGDGSVTFVEKQPVFFPGAFSGHINCSSLQYWSNEGRRRPAGPRPPGGRLEVGWLVLGSLVSKDGQCDISRILMHLPYLSHCRVMSQDLSSRSCYPPLRGIRSRTFLLSVFGSANAADSATGAGLVDT